MGKLVTYGSIDKTFIEKENWLMVAQLFERLKIQADLSEDMLVKVFKKFATRNKLERTAGSLLNWSQKYNSPILYFCLFDYDGTYTVEVLTDLDNPDKVEDVMKW